METHEVHEREVDDLVEETVEPAELADDRVRLAAAVNELEAAKARVARDAAFVLEETRERLVAELLPVLDNFDRAIAGAEASGDAPAIVEGTRLVHRQLANVLAGFGLERFDAIGDAFDPAMHEATTMIPVADPAKDRVVVDQLEPGYRFGGRLLRAAKVVVGKHVAG